MAAVQFYGINNVAREIGERDMPVVKLYQGKTFLHGSDPDDIIAMLGRMAEGGTDAEYTVKFFDDRDQDCGSFKFKLTEPGAGPYGINRMSGISSLEQRLAGIEKKLDKGDDDAGGFTIGKVLQYVEDNPFVQKMIMGLAGKYLKIPGLTAETSIDDAAIALAGVSEDEDRRIAAAIAKLKTRTDKVGEYLSKFAAMDDATFKQICFALDQM
jgi:hypothetical protein